MTYLEDTIITNEPSPFNKQDETKSSEYAHEFNPFCKEGETKKTKKHYASWPEKLNPFYYVNKALGAIVKRIILP